MEFRGVVSPLVTPFTASGADVDEGVLRRLTDGQIRDGVGGLATCGTTGEFASLTLDERRRVTDIVIDQVSGRVPVMVGVGSTSTAVARQLAEHAANAGAAALLVVPPYYGSFTPDELVAYYSAIGTIGLPICLYNIPAASGVGMSPELMLRIIHAVPQIKYLKDSTADLTIMATFLQEHAEKVSLLCGEELLVAPGLTMGLAGAVLGCANLLAPGVVRLVDAGLKGHFDEMQRINGALMPLMRFITSHPYFAAVKEGLDFVGFPVGPVRPPLLPLPEQDHRRLVRLLKQVDSGLITSAAGGTAA